MNYDVWIVVAIIALSVIAFAFELLRSDLVAILVMSLLFIMNIITPEEATRGFSSPATLTVACMFIISAAFVRAGLVDLASQLLTSWKKPNQSIALFAIMLLVGSISAFINNTAAVALFIPIAIKLAHASGANRKQFLMPLSFAAIFGGTCTLIGTSTNILVNSMYLDRGFKGFSIFEFAGVGAVLSVVGVFYMMTIGRLLLKSPKGGGMPTTPHEYLTEVVLHSNSPSVGKKLGESPLYKDFQDHIVTMKRGDANVPIDKEAILQDEDKFLLICGIEKIISLQKRVGISILEGEFTSEDMPKGFEIFEVIVPSTSDLVGHPLVDSGLVRSKGIIPLAVRHRQRTLFSFLRSSRIHPGDVLVVAGKPEAFEGFQAEERLVVLSQPKASAIDWKRIGFTSLLIFLMVTLSSLGFISILGAAIAVVAALLFSRTITLNEAYESLDAQVLILLSCIISLGLALEKSGGATYIAKLLVDNAGSLGPYVLVSVIYLVTSLLTEIMSNNATAALMAPIALDVALSMHLSEKPFLVAVMMAGSASFMTPVGYQTNTLIFAPGGYRFSDFLKVGTPLNLIFWLIATFLIPVFFPFN